MHNVPYGHSGAGSLFQMLRQATPNDMSYRKVLVTGVTSAEHRDQFFCIFRNACNVKQEFDVAGIAGMTQLETENSIQSITPILLNRLRVIFCLASVVKSKLCILCSILTPVTATFYRNSNLCLACLALRVMQVMWKLAIIRIPESTMRAPGPNRSTRWAKMTTINYQTTDEATTRAV